MADSHDHLSPSVRPGKRRSSVCFSKLENFKTVDTGPMKPKLSLTTSPSFQLPRLESSKSYLSSLDMKSPMQFMSNFKYNPSLMLRKQKAAILGSMSSTTLDKQKEEQERRKQALKKIPESRTRDDILLLEDSLIRVKFFEDITRDTRLALCRAVTFETMDPGYHVFREGEIGEKFYIIMNGTVTVRHRDPARNCDVTIATLTEGMSFGELALLSGQGNALRTASVLCTDRTDFLVLHKSDYSRILDHIMKKDIEEKVGFLRKVKTGAFQLLTLDTLESLAGVLNIRKFSKNGVVVKQGNDADELYFIKRGECRIVKEMKLERKLHEELIYLSSSCPAAVAEALRTSSSYERAMRRLQPAQMGDSGAKRLVDDYVGSLKRDLYGEDTQAYRNVMEGISAESSGASLRERESEGGEESSSFSLPNISPRSRRVSEDDRPIRIFLEVGLLGAYDIFGEMGITVKTKRACSVIANCQVEVYVLNKWDFQRRLHDDVLSRILGKVSTYQTDEEIQKEMVTTLRWMAFKKNLIDDIFQHKSPVGF